MDKTILVVEDETKIARTLRLYLEQAGFTVSVSPTGSDALLSFHRERPDLIILDLGLPGVDGLDVARKIRREADTPIIMLTARSEEADKLIGLELGADDYITKPFSPREVVARIRAVLRRTQPASTEPETVSAGDVSLDLVRRIVQVGGRAVELTPSEFDLLAVFARHPDQVFTRSQLLDLTQGDVYEGYERTIDQHIKNLRKKIEPDPSNPRYVLTVHGVGYKFSGK
jgi:two-component system, OmpR family, alkaline phosphatase synthesis response regulator PhoP